MNSEDTVRARGMLVERVLRYDTVSFTLGEEGGRGKALNNEACMRHVYTCT